MDEIKNKTFWVKHLNNEPVNIETHYFNNQVRKPPLTYVGDLNAAYKQEPGSLLANTDRGLITLYKKNVDALEYLNPWKLLTELPPNTGDDPFIIKSKNDISVMLQKKKSKNILNSAFNFFKPSIL